MAGGDKSLFLREGVARIERPGLVERAGNLEMKKEPHNSLECADAKSSEEHRSVEMSAKRIGWFTTARGPGSYNLFRTMTESIASGSIEAKLAFVFINRDVKGNKYRADLIKLAERAGVPVVILPSDTFRQDLKSNDLNAWRDAYGEAMRDEISRFEFDLGVLAGYMLIIDPETCRRKTIINLHPALPGTYKGTWEEIIGQVVDNGDKEYGAMVHVCTPDLDRGPVVAYDSFNTESLRRTIESRDELVKAIRGVEVKREAPLLMETIRMLVCGEVSIKNGRLYDAKGKVLSSYPNLADRIDAFVRELGRDAWETVRPLL